ncbi:OmpA family protein [Lacinutrix cladophorae]
MRHFITFLFILFSSYCFSQHTDLPKNPKPGKCYIRCFTENNKTQWEEVNCKYIQYTKLKIENFKASFFSEKDKKHIDSKLLKMLKNNRTIEIASHYHSNAADSINEKLSIEKGLQLADYLKYKGVSPNQIIINGYGNKRPKSRSKKNAYSLNSRFEYRLVSVAPK